MVLYTVLIGLATYRIVQLVRGFLPPKLMTPRTIHLSAVAVAAAGAYYLGYRRWQLVVVALAASTLASGWHLTMRFVYHAGTVKQLESIRLGRR